MAKWMQGALYLSLAAFIAKGLSALYKIPYQNMTGDEGFYVYQQVYPLYGVALVLGTYGFPLVIAKTVATNKASLQAELNLAFYTLMIVHTIVATIIFTQAETLAALMQDPALTPAIRWLAAPYLLIPFLAIGRGYYQGINNTTPTAISQVIEQLARVIAILAVAWLATDIYQAGTSAGIGALAGGILGITTLLILFVKSGVKPTLTRKLPHAWQQRVWTLLREGALVATSAMVLVLFQLVDTFTVYRNIQEGLNGANLKGVYDRSYPLIQFGAILTTVLSYAAVPTIAQAFFMRDKETVKTAASYAMKLSLVFGGAAAVGLMAILPVLNQAMFMNREGTMALQLMAFVILGATVFMTGAALLHAVGRASIAAWILLAGLTLKAVMNWQLVPHYDIIGAAWSSLSAMTVMGITMLVVLYQMKLIEFTKQHVFVRLPLSLFVMGISVALIGMVTVDSRLVSAVISILGVGVGIGVFILSIWRLPVFSQKEWEGLPKLGSLLPYRDRGGN
ncbi:polysaccharide biosynthesis protein [Paenalkalicoccus suaedae]|uniref:Polysaccharide biosynthesis protein n=1 Tax=Paenalkalicoccus suaedae TaxID=2592382 RepID=A0A859FBG3_9BACI|nr:polysaccharide biosynthesis protein [Paenalkalicoccus suaedae]QKS69645.1 polysaccharide biosynthesis protein [Paenalkalicoccus suaedae]